MDSPFRKKKLTSKTGFLIFLTSFLLYSLFSPGNPPGDTELRWSVSRQIIRGRGFWLEDSITTWNFYRGVDGKRYALYGLGQSLLLLPFTAIGLVLEKVTPIGADVADLMAQFLASVIMFPAIGAMGVWIFYRLVLALGYNKRTAVKTAAVLGGCTTYLHYSVNTQEQTQIALLMVLAVLFMVKYYREQRSVYVWLFCVAAGMCILFRPSSALEVLVICLAAVMGEIFSRNKVSLVKRLGRGFAAGILGIGSSIAIVGWYNYARFGSIFETGYAPAMAIAWQGHKLFESSPLPTLAAMLFSPGKGILFYNPVLILFALYAWGFFRRHKLVALAIFPAIAVNFIFHSFFTAWAGDYSWSTRYQVTMLPFLVLPLAQLFASNLKALAKRLVISLIIISASIQVISVVYSFHLEFVQNPNHCIIPDEWVWDWRQSHILMRFENIGRHILNNRDFSSVKVTEEEPLLLRANQTEQVVRGAYNINFYPFKAAALLKSKKVFYMLLCMWLANIGVFLLSMRRLVQVYSADNSAIQKSSA